MTSSTSRFLVAVLAALLPARALAGSLFSDDPATLFRGETISIEPLVGYLRGTSGEYVYNVPGSGSKLSQLDWSIQALAVGGRVAVRPFDDLTLRGRIWATVASDGSMTDYDWLGGYRGHDSWTHRSKSPDTDLGRAWQGDVSAAYKLYDSDDLALTGIAGFRHYSVKYNARGGSYIYSTAAFRDSVGMLPAGQLGIAYQQWFDTPYVGVGAVYNTADWTVSTEIIGSPFVMSRDKDYHALRTTLFREDFDMSGMLGASAGLEYRLSPVFSIAGRVEYQKYFEARGGTKIFNGSTGQALTVPKPGAGADADTLLLSLGVKGRL